MVIVIHHGLKDLERVLQHQMIPLAVVVFLEAHCRRRNVQGVVDDIIIIIVLTALLCGGRIGDRKMVEVVDTDLVAVFLRASLSSSSDSNFEVCAGTGVSAFIAALTGKISWRLRVPCLLGLFCLFPRHMIG